MTVESPWVWGNWIEEGVAKFITALSKAKFLTKSFMGSFLMPSMKSNPLQSALFISECKQGYCLCSNVDVSPHPIL